MELDLAVKKMLLVKELLDTKDKSFTDDYDWGFYNGLEFALSVLEERPTFYKNEKGKYHKSVLEDYPEYFL